MASNPEQPETSTGADPIPHFGLTIPFKYYIPESRLKSKNLDEDAMKKEYKALLPALQKVFREQEELH